MWPLENVPSYICSENWKPQWGRESAGHGTARCCLREASAAKPAQEPNSQMTSAEVLQVLFLGFLDYQLLSARTTTNPTEMKCQPQGGLDPLCSRAACPRLHHGAALSGIQQEGTRVPHGQKWMLQNQNRKQSPEDVPPPAVTLRPGERQKRPCPQAKQPAAPLPVPALVEEAEPAGGMLCGRERDHRDRAALQARP